MTFNKATQKYLHPTSGYWTARLASISDSQQFAGRVYLAVFSRVPTAMESAALAKYLQTPQIPRE